MKAGVNLPEVTLLHDARGARPEHAVGVGDFWYEPEVWALPLPPAARILYAGLCSFLGRGQINRKDLRNILKDCTDEEITGALTALIRHNILNSDVEDSYVVRSVRHFEGRSAY